MSEALTALSIGDQLKAAYVNAMQILRVAQSGLADHVQSMEINWHCAVYKFSNQSIRQSEIGLVNTAVWAGRQVNFCRVDELLNF